jgi:uncharacterized protein
MTTYFLDSSALIKRYVQEHGSRWVRDLVSLEIGHTVLLARATMVEVDSALARRAREGTVPASDCAAAANAFTAHSLAEYEFVELDYRVIRRARQLLEGHLLRALDAIQIASALVANDVLVATSLPPLVLLSSDDRMNEAALAEGLAIDNPTLHP